MDQSNYDGEESVLGAILMNKNAISHTEGLVSDDFALERHCVIFRAIEELHARNEPCDIISVMDSLKRSGQLSAAGGMAYLTRLTDTIPFIGNVAHYAKLIKRRAIERKLAEQCQAYLESYRAGNVDDSVNQHCANVNLLVSKGETGSWVSLRDSTMEVHSQAVEAAEHGDQRTLSTGIGSLDEALNGGLSPGDLVFIGARPAMGKTAMALTIATASRKRVGFFSLEMPRQQLASRYIAGVSDVNTGQLRSGHISDKQWVGVSRAVGLAERVPVWIDDSPGLTLREIKNRATALQIKHGVDLIVLDYLQLATAGVRNNRVQDVSAVSRGLKELAKQLEVPVIALAQLNRKLEERINKRPILSDLRESGQVEQDADIIIFLYREWVYNQGYDEPGHTEAIIAKYRNGKVGKVNLEFVPDKTLFRDW